jgi:hypothetical protein
MATRHAHMFGKLCHSLTSNLADFAIHLILPASRFYNTAVSIIFHSANEGKDLEK